MTKVSQSDEIVIVGAGCFGTSTAYHLLKRGFTKVTILDRSPTLPAPDAASNDFNRVVRSSYSDVFYTKLAREAIEAWKTREEWGNTYHESGVVIFGFSSEEAYADDSYRNDVSEGARIELLPDGDAIRTVFPPDVPLGVFLDHATGYLNYDGGWADAGQGVSMMISKVAALGAKVVPGKTVRKVVRGATNNTRRVVECDDGSVYEAALVIIATGSWTSSTFPDLASQYNCGLATGQCITMVELTEEEAKVFKDCPVVVDFGKSGYYVFPPNEKRIVKMAMHLAGYTHTADARVSTPRTILSHPDTGLLIPKANLQQLRENLRRVYPTLAEKPFTATRMCWYNDSPDGDWIIGHHPADPSLIIATGGSGHAYKFLPVIGRLVADTVDGTIHAEVAAKFAVERQYGPEDPSRRGDAFPTPLPLDQLCTPEDLLH